MQKKYSLLFGLITVAALMARCASRQELIPYPKKETLLMQRSDEFYKHLTQKNYGHLYEMFADVTRAQLTKGPFVAVYKKAFDDVTLRTLPSEIVHNNSETATTKTVIFFEFKPRNFVACIQLEWRWEKENWYIMEDVSCPIPTGNFKQ